MALKNKCAFRKPNNIGSSHETTPSASAYVRVFACPAASIAEDGCSTRCHSRSVKIHLRCAVVVEPIRVCSRWEFTNMRTKVNHEAKRRATILGYAGSLDKQDTHVCTCRRCCSCEERCCWFRNAHLFLSAIVLQIPTDPNAYKLVTWQTV